MESSFGFKMRGFIYWLVFLGALLVVIVLLVLPFIKERNFSNYLKRVENGVDLRGSLISVTARYEGSDENFFQYNADKRVHPGSNFKLFTAAAALNNLGKDFTFKTRVYAQQRGSKFDLILVGGGDPTLKLADFAELVKAVKNFGKTYGDIYYDDAYFSGEEYGPGWNPDWRDEYFSVPITGLQINDNLLNVRGGEIGKSGPDISSGSSSQFGMETKPLKSVKVIDSLRYFINSEGMEFPITATMDGSGVVTVKGDTMKELPFHTSAVMKDPSWFTAMVFKQELVQDGLVREGAKVIPFIGKIEQPYLTAGRQKLLYERKSALLSDIVFQMLKFSKNNYAETLIRTLGREVDGNGTQKMGVAVLNDFLAEIGLDEGDVSVFDGSALSPSTRVTGESILALFEFVNQQSWRDIFWNALPESQKDGTLKYRFDNAGLKHQVLGKTGTHEFSSSLSGKILREADGDKNILFSIHIYNHPYSTEESVIKVRPVIDMIVALLDQQF